MFVQEFIKLTLNEHGNSYSGTSRKVKKYLEVSQVLWKKQTRLSYYLVNFFFFFLVNKWSLVAPKINQTKTTITTT